MNFTGWAKCLHLKEHIMDNKSSIFKIWIVFYLKLFNLDFDIWNFYVDSHLLETSRFKLIKILFWKIIEKHGIDFGAIG